MIVHINRNGKKQKAEEHFLETANICAAIGKELNIEYTVYIAGLLHDLGKNKKEFEDYLYDVIENPKSRKRGEIDHSSAGGQFIYKYYNDNDYKKLAVELIAMAIFSHHGIMDMINIDGEERFLKRTNKTNIGYDEVIKNSSEFLNQYNFDDLLKKSEKEIETIFDNIKIFIKKNNLKTDSCRFMLGSLQRLVTSILIDADRTDTADFMTEIKSDRNINYRELWQKYIIKLDNKLNEFNKYKDTISLLRRKMSDECFKFAENKCGIYCLPVPTGGGKTLASLRFALEHCRLYGKEKIIYTAPYLSILEQNASEIKGILKDDENIFEHHSNIFIDNDDEKDYYKYLCDSWTSPIILTSMVRLLETMFSADTTSVRRFNKLANSVIIIDEVQNLPVKLVNMFNMMANFLSCLCNTTIVLCSATQPLLGDAPKKIVYGKPKNMITDAEKISDSFKRVRIIDKTAPEKYTTSSLADFVLEKTEDNMLVILNTKSAVNKLCDELRSRNSEYEIYQLTTYMCPQHRNDVITEIKKKLGSSRLICVSTQLIEAGVDISFDNVIRSVAGLDSIIQAAGRCNRHGKYKIRNVYIVNYAEENISRLKDINKAQTCMRSVLLKYNINYEKCGEDYLISNSAIKDYYEKYFYSRESEMDYNTGNNIIQTLFGALSNNSIAAKNRKEKNGTIMTQAYKFAGDNFEVIDSNTVGVIVPYRDAVEKIKKINSAKSLGEIKQIVSELQRYTVNVYNNSSIFNELKERRAVVALLEGSIYMISDGFYDENVGLNTTMEKYVF